MAISGRKAVWAGCICMAAASVISYQAGHARQEVNLQGARAPYAGLAGVQLPHSSLAQADLRRVNLFNADLEQSNLSRANLQHANLVAARLRGATLLGADLRAATLDAADLTHADLHGALYDDLTVWPDCFDPQAAGAVLWVRAEPASRVPPLMLAEFPHHLHLRNLKHTRER